MDGSEISGVAITGTIGAGKTALAEALSELLHAKSIRHALIDVDWLGQLYPVADPGDPHSFELAFKNLRAIAPNFVSEGARYFIIALTLTSREELEELQSAIPEVSLTVCRVEVSPGTAAERIERRELGGLKEDFLTRTDALAQQIRDAGIEDVVVINDDVPITEIAKELVERLGWS